MKAITIRQPWASLIAAGVKTIETRPRRTAYRGRVAIHAAKTERPEEPAIVALPQFHDALWPALGFSERPMPGSVRALLPRGAVVASAVLTDCVPILADDEELPVAWMPHVAPSQGIRGELLRWLGSSETECLSTGRLGWRTQNIEDQRPFGDYSPGRWALLLDDIAPTTERCPWCWGGDDAPTPCLKSDHGYDPGCFGCQLSDCPACGGDLKCEPVPARGNQPVPWEWTP